MPNYSVGAVTDPYVSKFLAGVSGTLVVLFTAFILGTAIKKHAEVSDKQ
jgi:hypothetical protein